MSVSNYTLNQRITALQYQINNPPNGGYVTINNNQTINDIKTFTDEIKIDDNVNPSTSLTSGLISINDNVNNINLTLNKNTLTNNDKIYISPLNELIISSPTTVNNIISATSFNGPASQVLTTTNNTNNTYFVPFTSGAGNSSLLVDNVTGPLSYNPSNGTLTANTFNGMASNVQISAGDTESGTFFLTYVKNSSAIGSLFIDNTLTPLTYNPSIGGLTCTIIVCPRYDSSSNSANCSLFGNTATGNIVIGNAMTTGNVSIAATNQTTGSVNIGSTTSSGAGVVNIRPPLVCARQIRTTNNATYIPTNVLDLGYQVTVLGSSFTTNILASSTITNVYSVAFTSANYGVYQFTSQVLITPDDTTANRQIDMSLSTTSASFEVPYFSRAYVTPSSPQPPSLNLTRIISIYANTTVYLTCRCQNSSATILTAGNNGLFTYTRIA